MLYHNHSQSLWRLIGHSKGKLNSWDDGGAHFPEITNDFETKRKIVCRVSWFCIFFLSKRGNKTVTSYFYDWRVRNIRNRFIQFSTRGFNPSYRAKACICHPARSIYNKPINVYVKQKMCSNASFLFLHAVSAINCDLFKTACAFIIGLLWPMFLQKKVVWTQNSTEEIWEWWMALCML